MTGERQPAIDPQKYLPLREPTFFILLSLANGKKHGYAILKNVESLSNGKIVLSNGTLYGGLLGFYVLAVMYPKSKALAAPASSEPAIQ